MCVCGEEGCYQGSYWEERGEVAMKQGKMPAEVVLRRVQFSRGREREAVQRSKIAEIIGLSCHLSALIHVPAE